MPQRQRLLVEIAHLSSPLEVAWEIITTLDVESQQMQIELQTHARAACACGFSMGHPASWQLSPRRDLPQPPA
jgi:ABC-type microcin C transport system duplicated ATPase subunit YejF